MRAHLHRRLRLVIEASLALAVFFIIASPTSGQTLADVARQEEARRKAIKKPSKLYTNASLRPAAVTDAVPAGTPPAMAPADKPAPAIPAAGGAANAPGAAGADTPSTTGGLKDEAYWRRRIGDARAQRDRNAVYLESLESRINGLWADFTARDDPAQRAVIAQNRQRALDERDRLSKDQLALEKRIKDIEEEARRANVPPGWLR